MNPKSSAKISVEVTNGYFKIRTDKEISVGEEVFISYGAHQDAFLLVEYGFIIGQSNPLNTVAFCGNDILMDSVMENKTRQFGCSDGFAISPGRSYKNGGLFDVMSKILKFSSRICSKFLAEEVVWKIGAI